MGEIKIKRQVFYQRYSPVPDPFYIVVGFAITSLTDDWRKHKLRSVLKEAKKEIPELKPDIEKVEEALKIEDYAESRKEAYKILKDLVPKIEKKNKELAEEIAEAWDKFRVVTIYTNPLVVGSKIAEEVVG
jgi:hypothetical protein